MRLGKSILFALFLLTGTLGYSQQTIFINEILAGNENDIWDEFSQHEDWLEIYYQAGSSPALVNLAGYYLSDDPDSLTKWQIPDTNQGLTTVPQGQHIVFFIDKDPNQGENHVDFKLSLDGETVTLTEPDGVTIVDQITYPMMVDDISYGRSSDGADDWVFFNNTTPDDPNAQGEFVPEVLFINEVMTNNTSNIYDEMDEHEQWVEIYNPNPYQVNLAGYHFTTTDGDSPVFEIPDTDPLLTVIPAEGFLVFWFDGETADGENHVSFSLEEGGNVQLTGQFVSNVIDSYDYPVLAENESWGRQTDGSGTSISFSIPTPRVTNSLVIVEPEELYKSFLRSPAILHPRSYLPSSVKIGVHLWPLHQNHWSPCHAA